MRGRRGEQLAPLPRRDLIELSTGGSRRFEVSDRKGDLHPGGEQCRPPERQNRLVQGSANGCGRRPSLALSQAEQSEPR